MSRLLTRREFCALLGAGAAGLGCRVSPLESQSSGDPLLSARPVSPSEVIGPGWHQLWQEGPAAHLLVPVGYDPSRSWPLVVGFHGAGGTADGHRAFLGESADNDGFLLLVPDSAERTWDVVLNRYGPDIATVDRALKATFRMARVNPAAIAIEGFSDGASYALGVGIRNPQLFSRVVAFSPGFVAPTLVQAAKPRVFISHGTRDPILPIDTASRRIVPALRGAGFEVDYREFDGGHEAPPEIIRAAVAFIVGSGQAVRSR